jgi:hypothetical protein
MSCFHVVVALPGIALLLRTNTPPTTVVQSKDNLSWHISDKQVSNTSETRCGTYISNYPVLDIRWLVVTPSNETHPCQILAIRS